MGRTEYEWAIIKSTVAPIKQEPDFNSELSDEVLFGMVVKILNCAGQGWYYIETGYDYKGYIHESNLVLNTEEALKWKDNAQYFIEHSIVDVMDQPKYASRPVELLTRGALICTNGKEEDKWIEVLLPQNRAGWVRKEFLRKIDKPSPQKDEDELRKKLVHTALSYLGTQYRWGGKSSMGIDCSGLCSIAYLMNGIVIYRDAELKDEYMRRISMEEAKPGDLLFWPGHVAMYIGNGRYVHSTGREGSVVINSLIPDHQDYRDDLARNITGVGTIF